MALSQKDFRKKQEQWLLAIVSWRNANGKPLTTNAKNIAIVLQTYERASGDKQGQAYPRRLTLGRMAGMDKDATYVKKQVDKALKELREAGFIRMVQQGRRPSPTYPHGKQATYLLVLSDEQKTRVENLNRGAVDERTDETLYTADHYYGEEEKEDPLEEPTVDTHDRNDGVHDTTSRGIKMGLGRGIKMGLGRGTKMGLSRGTKMVPLTSDTTSDDKPQKTTSGSNPKEFDHLPPEPEPNYMQQFIDMYPIKTTPDILADTWKEYITDRWVDEKQFLKATANYISTTNSPTKPIPYITSERWQLHQTLSHIDYDSNERPF